MIFDSLKTIHNSLYLEQIQSSTKPKYGERVDFLNLEGDTKNPHITKIEETTDKEGIMT